MSKKDVFKKLFAKNGQTHCHECGSKFEIDRPWDGQSTYQSTTCPNGCRGSWVSDERNSEFDTEF